MIEEQINSELEKYKPVLEKLTNYVVVLKKEKDKISNDTTIEDAKTELDTEITKLEPIEEK